MINFILLPNQNFLSFNLGARDETKLLMFKSLTDWLHVENQI